MASTASASRYAASRPVARCASPETTAWTNPSPDSATQPRVDDRDQRDQAEQEQRRQHADVEEVARVDRQGGADADQHEADVEDER